VADLPLSALGRGNRARTRALPIVADVLGAGDGLILVIVHRLLVLSVPAGGRWAAAFFFRSLRRISRKTSLMSAEARPLLMPSVILTGRPRRLSKRR
jgi:hypothetical protein